MVACNFQRLLGRILPPSPFTVIPSVILLFVFFEEDLEELGNFSTTVQDLIQGRVTSVYFKIGFLIDP